MLKEYIYKTKVLFSWVSKWKSLSRDWLFANPWNSPGQNTGVGSLSFPQGIFPIKGLKPGLPLCRWIPYQLSHKILILCSVICILLTHWKRLWCWEGLGAGEGDDRGWDGWRASLTRWAWVWVNSRSWWWTGRPGMLQVMGSWGVRHDWATELNWTEWEVYSGSEEEKL